MNKKKDPACEKAIRRMSVISSVCIGIAIASLAVLFSSCSPKIVEKVVEKEKVVYKDSISYRDSIIAYPIPLEKDQAIVHIGDTSFRKTSLAHSEAWVSEDGFLHHSLENNKGNININIKIPSRTIWVNVESNKTEFKEIIREVEKPLSWWRKFKIDCFWPFLVVILLLLVWTFRKLIFRL